MEEIKKEILEMKKRVNYFKMCSGPFPTGLINKEGTPHPFIKPTELNKEIKLTRQLIGEEKIVITP